MSDLTPSDPTPAPRAPTPGAEQELDVDLAAFLPEGVALGEATDVEVDEVEVVLDTDEGPVVIDEVEAVIQTDHGVVLVDEVVVATADGVVEVDEVVIAVDDEADEAVAVVAEPPAPAVDLEALGQIERDLDAVDAAIAALDAGTYGIDPVSGQLLDDALLAEDPTRLR